MTERKGVTAQYAKLEMRRRHTLIGAMMVHLGDADGLICGTFGSFGLHLNYVDQVLGHQNGLNTYAAMNLLILPNRTVAIVDTHVNENPSAEQLTEITLMAADELKRIGMTPRAALLSHSNFGGSRSESSEKMRQVLHMVRERRPDLNIDGEMHGDVALDQEMRKGIMPRSTLQGEANLLIMPSIDAANISYNLLKVAAGNNIAIGPILLGCKSPATILTSSATSRRIVNMTALTVLAASGAK